MALAVFTVALAAALDKAQLLDAALASPRLVAVHDKQAWLALFATDASIADPVGSPPSATPEQRELFYNTFIRDNDISMDVLSPDIAAVRAREVVRHVRIHAKLYNGAHMAVPAHLHYTFNADGKVKALQAHWQVLDNMPVLESIYDVPTAMWGASVAFYNILQVRGWEYFKGYLTGTMVFGVGRAERRAVQDFAAAVTSRDVTRITSLVPATTLVSFPVQDVTLPAGRVWESGIKSLTTTNLRAAGQWMSFDFTAEFASGTFQGLGFFEFPADMHGKVGTAKLYYEEVKLGGAAAAASAATGAGAKSEEL